MSDKKDVEVQYLKILIINMEQQLNAYRNQCEQLTKIFEDTNNERKELSQKIIVNAGNIVNKTIGTIDFLIKHFTQTPILEEIKDFSIIKNADGNEEYSVAEIVIFHFNHNTLHKFLGQIIVSVYKKDDPREQSIWSTDVERMSYLIRDIIKNDDIAGWITDKKGVRVREKAIMPMLRFIRKELRNYIKNCNKKKVTRSILANMQLANNLIALIGDTSKKGVSELAHKINKFISNYFYLDKNNVIKLIK